MFIRRNKSRKVGTMGNITVGEQEDKEKQDPSPSQPKLSKRPRIPTTPTLETVTPSLVPQPDHVNDSPAHDQEEEEKEEIEEEEEDDDDETGVVVTLKDSDSDLLDCPICAEPFRSHVYQCENGHLICDSCCKEVHHKCPSCSLPVGFIRNRAVERIVELAITSCHNRQHGCMERLSYLEKLEHEKECQYTLTPCPSPDCQYIGVPASFHNHFNEKRHRYVSVRMTFDSIDLNGLYKLRCSKHLEQVFFLKESSKKLLFVVKCIGDSLGCFVHVCAPPTASDIEFSYDLAVGTRGNSIKVESSVEITPKCFVPPAKENCVLFPVGFNSEWSGDCFYVHLVIKEKEK